MTGKVLDFPSLADWLKPIAARGNHAFIRDADRMIQYHLALARSVPVRYGWRFSSTGAIRKQLDTKKTPSEINRVYWSDQARNAEAYGLLTSWRGIDLLSAAVSSLNRSEVLVTAVLTRACLELAATFLTNANVIERSFGQTTFSDRKVVVSPDLEKLIVKMIWGTRLGEPAEYLKQTNILTVIQKLAKNPHLQELPERYSYLCELAHPNFIGNALYWSHVDKVYDDGSERRVLARFNDNGIREEVVHNILWALGWSAVCLRNGLELVQLGVASILKAIDERPKRRG